MAACHGYLRPAGGVGKEEGRMWDRMGFFTGNLPLDLAILSWLAAQLIKTVIKTRDLV